MYTPTTQPSDEGGFTLIEVLVALVILGVGVAALVAGIGMQAKTSLGNRNQSQAAATLTAAAEYVKSLPFTAGCPGTQVPIASAAVPRDSANFSVSYKQLQVGSTSCSSLVLARVMVTSITTDYSLSVDVLKRPIDGP